MDVKIKTPSKYIDLYKLINLVRINRCLYDQAHINHNNRTTVNNVWKLVAQEMNQPDCVCREKWINLRSNFARELRKTRRRNHDLDKLGPRKTTWAYFDSLSFLMPYVRSRLDPSIGEDENSPGVVRIKLEREDSVEMDPLDLIETPEEVSSSEDDSKRWLSELDDDRWFLLSLLPKMKQLDTIDNFRFRIDVQNLLLDRLEANMSSANQDHPSVDPLS